MTDEQTAAHSGQGHPEKNPDHWVTGDAPMTGAQRSYLKTLCEETKVEFDANLTKAEASRRIDELQRRTGRGRAAQGVNRERARAAPARRAAFGGHGRPGRRRARLRRQRRARRLRADAHARTPGRPH
jgi:hypothetical protein